jgi:hypothetical protein
MPFCPHCLYEFVEGFEKCPDCRTALVDRLPEGKAAEVKWFFLDTLPDVTMAEMIKEALENSGIKTILKTDPLHTIFSLTSTGLAGSYAKLYVPIEKRQAALDILNSMTNKDD